MFGLSAIAIKAIIAAVGLSAIIGAGTWLVIHQRHIGRDAAIAQMTKESAAESERRRMVVEEAMKIAEAAAAKLQIVEDRNAAMLQQIETLSARNDGNPCLDLDAIERLRKLDGGDGR